MRVAFRADAGSVIGSGHVMRCLTLADALRSQGADTRFVCRAHPGHLGEAIAARGHALTMLSAVAGVEVSGSATPAYASWLGADWEEDAAQTSQVLAATGAVDWLVADHYAIDARWESALRPVARRIFVIDDLADRPHDCDLLLDQNFFLDQDQRYAGLVGSACHTLLGPRFALLRPEFGAAADKQGKTERVRNVLIYLGNDTADLSSRAVRAIQASERSDLQVQVVLGKGHPSREAILNACSRHAGFSVHENVANMAQLMAWADLAIGAAGSSTWERACLGVPTILVSLADNQRRVAEDFAASGGCLYLGADNEVTVDGIDRAFQLLCENRPLRHALGSRSRELVDGNGVARVSARMWAKQIRLRPANAGDMHSVYLWRNAEETRLHSHDPQPIPLEVHSRWFEASVCDPDRFLLIGELNNEPIGVLRYDVAQERATISVYLVPGHYGKGLGAGLIEAGSAYLGMAAPGVREIVAEVYADNVGSRKAFEIAGYALKMLQLVQTLKDGNAHR